MMEGGMMMGAGGAVIMLLIVLFLLGHYGVCEISFLSQKIKDSA